MAQKRGWQDWVKGVALYGITDQGDLVLLRCDTEGNLSVKILPHAVTHQAGGSDEINVEGLKGVLADLQFAKWSVYDLRANFPASAQEGALAYATDEQILYRWDGSAWVQVLSMGRWYYYGVKSGFPITAPEGSLAYATDEKTLYRWDGSAWVKVLSLDFNQLINTLHASRHQPGGSDPIPTGIPSAITEGATASEGTSTQLARADHVHATPSTWTPRVHGNEAHSPDFVAVDGSTPLTGDWDIGDTRKIKADHIQARDAAGLKLTDDAGVGLHVLDGGNVLCEGSILGKVDNGVVRELGRLGCSISGYDNRGAGFILPGAWDRLLFLDKKGGAISATKSPAGGSLSGIVDGSGSSVYWTANQLPVVVTLTLEQDYLYCRDFFIHFHPWHAPKEFKVRFKKADGTLLKEVHKIDWQPSWGTFVLAGENSDLYYTRYIEIELIQGQAGYNYVYLFEVVWLAPTYTTVVEPALYRGGGDMYGDIDMNGNDILNPGLVDGVDVSAHASRHKAGGADELAVPQLAGIGWKGVQIYSGVPSAWQTLDLSSHVGSRRALIGIRISHPGAYTKDYMAVPGDWTTYPPTDFEYHVGPYAARIDGGKQGALVTWTDASGRIKVWTNSAESGDKWYLEWYIGLT